MSRPTIDDVARLAGVSIATVSRCLHTPDIVAAKTRERVLDAVRATEYNLNAAAQSLRSRRANTVLVVVPDIGAYDAFYKKLIAKINLTDVSSSFAMGQIKYTTALPLEFVSVADDDK